MKNKYKIDGDVLIVYNRKDNREILFDAEDFDFVNQHTWRIHKNKKTRYEHVITNITFSSGKYKTKIASRLLMREPIDMMVDHKNGNPLDNRKSNLRIATDQINQHNQIRAKGYSWHKRKKVYSAYIKLNYKKIHLGTYNTEEDARAAYLEAKKKYHPTAPHHLYS